MTVSAATPPLAPPLPGPSPRRLTPVVGPPCRGGALPVQYYGPKAKVVVPGLAATALIPTPRRAEAQHEVSKLASKTGQFQQPHLVAPGAAQQHLSWPGLIVRTPTPQRGNHVPLSSSHDGAASVPVERLTKAYVPPQQHAMTPDMPTTSWEVWPNQDGASSYVPTVPSMMTTPRGGNSGPWRPYSLFAGRRIQQIVSPPVAAPPPHGAAGGPGGMVDNGIGTRKAEDSQSQDQPAESQALPDSKSDVEAEQPEDEEEEQLDKEASYEESERPNQDGTGADENGEPNEEEICNEKGAAEKMAELLEEEVVVRGPWIPRHRHWIPAISAPKLFSPYPEPAEEDAFGSTSSMRRTQSLRSRRRKPDGELPQQRKRNQSVDTEADGMTRMDSAGSAVGRQSSLRRRRNQASTSLLQRSEDYPKRLAALQAKWESEQRAREEVELQECTFRPTLSAGTCKKIQERRALEKKLKQLAARQEEVKNNLRRELDNSVVQSKPASSMAPYSRFGHLMQVQLRVLKELQDIERQAAPLLKALDKLPEGEGQRILTKSGYVERLAAAIAQEP